MTDRVMASNTHTHRSISTVTCPVTARGVEHENPFIGWPVFGDRQTFGGEIHASMNGWICFLSLATRLLSHRLHQSRWQTFPTTKRGSPDRRWREVTWQGR